MEKGFSLEYLEEATKIRAKYLEALENERFDVLPGPVYAKAFLRTYAKFLNLDTEAIMQEFSVEGNEPVPDLIKDPQAEPEPGYTGGGKNLRYLVAGFAIIALLGVHFFYDAGRPEENKPNLPQTAQQQQQTQPENNTGAGNQPPQEQTVEGVRVTLKVMDGQSWMQIVADGNTVFSGTVSPGETKDFQAQEKIYLHVGNAGAVEVNVNGKDLGRLGQTGKVVRNTFYSGQEPEVNRG
ncbi:helix-turn-helix domain-containing protein [Desulforamulus ruminis]|uniref:Cytoskeleton protein RodZ-like C-terminal domain-containing protein n=2 Tax=Desulforamulus ruminis TaxID=1564 RepID=F6DUP9_DESRL|nr:RodZ domain-containing protein [Desulforamulus ruminis]AEG60187.1 hypothetical protein Desru_1928 [Desulforamulus ruminis DSM 2154]